MSPMAINNEYARYKIWAGNLGALQRGRSSLDVRLRDSVVMRQTVLNLLDQLQDSLIQSIEITTGVRLPLEQQAAQQYEQAREGCSDHGDQGSLKEIDDESDVEDTNELAERLSEIKEIMSHLYRLSFKIRSADYRSLSAKPLLLKNVDPDSEIDLFSGNASPDYQYESQLLGYASFDRQYVLESLDHLRKASRAPNTEKSQSADEDALFERLSKAITNRRRYFAYWRKHALKLSSIEEESGHHEKKLDRPSASKVAGHLMQEASRPNIELTNPANLMPDPGPKTVLSVTDISKYKGNLDDRFDSQTIISYATTAYDMDHNFVEVPPLPSEAISKPEFVCPYCWVVCPSRQGKGKHWRAHVLQDLQPYVCTYPECLDAERLYASRQAWLEHERSVHRRIWRCPVHSALVYKSKEDLQLHFANGHPDLTESQIQTLVDLAETTVVDERQICPFCSSKGPFDRGLHNHMASHQERLAMFALPQNNDSGDGDDAPSGNAQGTKSAGSLHSISLDFSDTQLQNHENAVSGVAFSPDSKLLASASYDKTVRLWDSATGAAIYKFEHAGEANDVAFSPDGKLLASASDDLTVKLWDPVIGEAINTLRGHGKLVLYVAFSPDSRLLASNSHDMTIKLWDPATGAAISTLEGHSGEVAGVAFSPDGKVLASASWDKTIKLWDPATGAAINTLEGHSGEVVGVAFSPDGKVLASASSDKTIKLWDPATGAAINTLEGHSGEVIGVAFSPDGKVLASTSWDETIKLWDPATGAAINTLEGHSRGVLCVAFSPDGKVLASASKDRTIKLWDPVTGQIIYTLGEPF